MIANQDCHNIPMCRTPATDAESPEETIVFERRPSKYFMLDRDTLLLFRLAGMKLKPAQQERLYWNLLHLLNALEEEEKEMTSPYNGYIQKEKKKNETFDGGGYGIFWDEYHSFEQSQAPSSTVIIPDSEDGLLSRDDKSEREIQWLSDVGFTNIAKKIRARHEIDQNDDEMKIITASLTRAQANAVRRRIDSLNDVIRQHNPNEKTPNDFVSTSTSSRSRRHVKDIFGRNDTSKTGRKSPSSAGKKIQNDRSWIKLRSGDETAVSGSKEIPDKSSPPPMVPPKPDVQRPSPTRSPPVAVPTAMKDINVPPRTSHLTINITSTRYTEETTTININDTRSKEPLDNAENISTHKSPRRGNSPSSSPKIASSPRLDNSPQLEYSPRLGNSPNLSSSHRIENTIRLDNTPRNDNAPQLNNTYRLDHSARLDNSPQLDNLVRRTSANNLIIMSAEEREKLLGPPLSGLSPKEAENQFEFPTTGNKSDVFESPPRKPVIKKRETFDTSSLQRPDNEYAIKSRQSRRASSQNNDKSAANDAPVSNQEKRLVVVDSTYINVSSVGDGYTTIKTFVEVDDVKNETRKEKTSENSTFYTTDNHSLQPYDNLDVDLSRNFSDISFDTTSDILTPPRTPSAELPTPITETDGNSHSSSSIPRHKHKDRKQKIKDSETTEKHHQHHRHKERKRHRHKKHKENEQENNNNINGNNDKIQEQHNEIPPFDMSLVNESGRSPTLSHSDECKSVGSAESIDDIHVANVAKENFPRPKNIYCSSSDSNRSTPDKSLDSDFSTPRTQSPCLEGDAKLDVGSTPTPRVHSRSPAQDPIQGPHFPKLPNFTLTKEELGSTHMGDLSDVDMAKTRQLALIELTALFDNCSIPINRRKSQIKLKFKDSGTFGVPLTTLCTREEGKESSKQPGEHVRIPKMFLKLVDHLEKYGLHEEGILRIPGSTQRVKAIREEADKNELDTLNLKDWKITDVATCLKLFLRDLPEPLLTHEYQNTFTAVADIGERKVQLQALNLLVVLLPPVHQETLKHLLVFLNRVVANETYNKMGLNNVAMIMAPNLFFQNNATINITEAKKAAGMTDVLRMLIKYQKILWTIPSFMVSQIRFLNEAGAKTKDPKTLRNIIKRRKKESPYKGQRIVGSSGDELDDDYFIIKVKAPTLNKQSMAIQLSTQTTVSEVVSKFQWQRQKSNKKHDEIDTSRLCIKPKDTDLSNSELFLYEVGGNIGERRLDSGACISAIYRENPNAEWVLKSEIRR